MSLFHIHKTKKKFNRPWRSYVENRFPITFYTARSISSIHLQYIIYSHIDECPGEMERDTASRFLLDVHMLFFFVIVFFFLNTRHFIKKTHSLFETPFSFTHREWRLYKTRSHTATGYRTTPMACTIHHISLRIPQNCLLTWETHNLKKILYPLSACMSNTKKFNITRIDRLKMNFCE